MNSRMSSYKLSLTEKLVLAMVAVVIATGFAFFFFNISLFNQYVIEDGLVEWLTVAGLFLACLVCFSRKLSRNKYASPTIPMCFP